MVVERIKVADKIGCSAVLASALVAQGFLSGDKGLVTTLLNPREKHGFNIV